MGVKVLIVDDSPFMRAVLKAKLEAAGFKVVGEARDGEEAVDVFRRSVPDVVLMDVIMPGVDGIEGLKRIMDVDPNARVVMITAVGQRELAKLAMRLGAIGVLVKPFDDASLVRVVREAAGVVECL